MVSVLILVDEIVLLALTSIDLQALSRSALHTFFATDSHSNVPLTVLRELVVFHITVKAFKTAVRNKSSSQESGFNALSFPTNLVNVTK